MTALTDDTPRGLVPRADLYRALQRLDDALAERDELRESLARLVHAEAAPHIKRLGFSPGQARIIAAMLDGKVASYARLAYASSDGPDTDADNVSKVQICLIRRRAAAMGFTGAFCETVWSMGYALTPAALAWLRARAPEAFTQGAAP